MGLMNVGWRKYLCHPIYTTETHIAMENTNQMMDLSADEMLELYKTMTHLAPVRRECTIERDDGIDLDAWLTLRLPRWNGCRWRM